MGDFNWLTPSFLAFASPQHTPTAPILPSSPHYATLPTTPAAIAAHATLPNPFKNVLTHFSTKNIGLVVRLNSELYSPSYFTALGISHIDMIFDDGTCPPLPLVKRFIKLAHDTITVRKAGIAVHCKAGLGRTGCLIGAYLIYRHGFTANEIIAFMRFMRPGMVVGPQQHWLHLNQGAFREWWFEDQMKDKLAAAAAVLPCTPTRNSAARGSRLVSNGSRAQVSTPPARATRAPLGEVDQNGVGSAGVASSPPVPATHAQVEDDTNLPAPTPGQPRKTSRSTKHHHHPYSRQVSSSTLLAEEKHAERATDSETDVISIHRQLGIAESDGTESEEEFQMRLLAAKRSSPAGRVHKERSISCSTTTTTTTSASMSFYERRNGAVRTEEEDVENRGTPPPRGGSFRAVSGAGVLTKTRGGMSPKRGSDKESAVLAGVRKSSGRVGSMGIMPAGRKI
jgi:cell division cycle 14